MAIILFSLLALVGALLFVAGFFIDASVGAIGFLLLAGGSFGCWKALSRQRQHRDELLRRISELERQLPRDAEARLGALEQAVGRFRSAETGAPVEHSQAEPSAVAVVDAPAPELKKFAASAQVSEQLIAPKIPELRAPIVVEPVAPAPQPTIAHVEPAPASPRSPVFHFEAQPPAPPMQSEEPARSAIASVFDFEQNLGTNWLSKIGIAILVLGIAFFLAWQLKELGPAGKVLVGVLTSAALVGVGTFFERNERYRILARAAVAGGWPLLFFVAYAAYFVPAAKVIHSPVGSLACMFLVGMGMVTHTLRYRSQWVTSLAFILAFVCVALNRVGAVSLSANVILAAALVVVVLRMRWYHLEMLGIVAVYLNHFYWLRPIIEPMAGKKVVFPEFYTSAILLVLYWAVFRASFLLRRQPLDERVSVSSAILNSALLLGVLKYQAARPELAFWGLLVLGATELLLGAISFKRQQRTSFVVVSTIGCALCVAAIPFRFTPDMTAPVWLAEAAALMTVGIVLKEILFRRLGLIGCIAVSGQLLGVQMARVVGARMDGSYVVSHLKLGIVIAIAASVFYCVSHLIPKRVADAFPTSYDRTGCALLSWLSVALLLGGGWAVWYGSGAALAWMLIATGLFYCAKRFGGEWLESQALSLTLATVLRVLEFNLLSAQRFMLHGPTQRLLTVGAVVALLYVCGRLTSKVAVRGVSVDIGLRWSATVIAMLLTWYELVPAAVVLGWTALGLLLFEAAQRNSSEELRWHSRVVLACTFGRLFFANLNIISSDFWRILTVAPVVLALFYVYEVVVRTNTTSDRVSIIERYITFTAAVVSLAALLRFETNPDWVATVWALLTAALLWLSLKSKRPEILPAALLFAALACGRGILHNLYERTYFPPATALGRWPGVLAPFIILLASLPLAYRERTLTDDSASERSGIARMWRALTSRPEQTIFFAAFVLLTALLWTETSKSWLTISWAAEAVAVFFFAVLLRERSFRLAGLSLLLVCVGKIIVMDVWTFGIRERALTFIALGAGLLSVSILYSRKREMLREIL